MSRPEDDVKTGMVSVCYLTQLLFQQIVKLELSAKDIADGMTRYSGESISPSSVGHYNDATNTGIPKPKIGAYLDAHELKVVPKENICIPPSRWASVIHLANERMAQLAEEEARK